MRFLVATLFGAWAGPAAAFCGTYVGSPGVELTNQTSQVIIARQGNQTTLTLANDYQGDATNFALLIPVPVVLEEEDIRMVGPELFQRFDDYSAPRIVTYECNDWGFGGGDVGGGVGTGGGGFTEPSEDSVPVVVEGEYEIGIYDVVILSATESSALIDWLTENGYGANPQAEEMLTEYIEEGQLFFAAKVNLSDVSEEGTTLEPLQFTYESEGFGLPVRLGTLNSPGEQDVVMFIVTDESDGQVGISNYSEIAIEDECMVDVAAEGGASNYYGGKFSEAWAEEGTGEGWITEYAWATSSCDPCPTSPPTNEELAQAGYDGDSWDSYFTRLRIRYTADAATQDIMLYTSGIRSTEQIRFIDYNEEMEDRFEVCGIGMVEDPGTCEETSTTGASTGGEHSEGNEREGGHGEGEAGGEDDGNEEGNGWDRQDTSTELNPSSVETDKGGCSHVGRSRAGLVWSILFGMMAVFGRRRSSAGRSGCLGNAGQ